MEDPTLSGGANDPSLSEAQKTYIEYGAIEKKFVAYIRKPTQKDIKDPEWYSISQKGMNETSKRTTKNDNKQVTDKTEAYYWRNKGAPNKAL